MVRDGLGFILLWWTSTFDTVVNNGVIGVELRCGSLSSRGATFPNADNLLLQHQTAVETTIHEVPLLRFHLSLVAVVLRSLSLDHGCVQNPLLRGNNAPSSSCKHSGVPLGTYFVLILVAFVRFRSHSTISLLLLRFGNDKRRSPLVS